MPSSAPRRPALLPALLFVAASLSLRHGPVPLVAALVLSIGVYWRTAPRRFDLWLLAAALGCGWLHGWHAESRHSEALGRAALSSAVGVPFEDSWRGVLTESPKRIQEDLWVLSLRARIETADPVRLRLEVAVTDPDERDRLAGMNAGDRLRVWARVVVPREPWGGRALSARGRIKSTRLIEPIGEPTKGPLHRDELVRRLWKIHGSNEPLAGFLCAVLLGDRSYRDPEGEARLRGAGLSHLLAVSGLHVGVIAGCVLLVGRALRRGASRFALVAVALGCLGWLVGWAVPVQRAVGSAVLLGYGQAIGREGETLNRLACMALGLAWLLPGTIDAAAYVLSFTATCGIVLATRERPGSATTAVRACVGAYLATAPWSAAYFGQVAPWAVLANMLSMPFVVLLLTAGYASLVLAGLPVLGPLSIGATRLAFAAIERIAGAVDRLPCSPWFVAQPPAWLLALLALAGLGLALGASTPLRRASALVFAAGIVFLHLGPPPTPRVSPAAELLDVGQGQALVWRSPHGVTLVDAAGRGYGRWDPGARVVRPALLARGSRRIDRLVLSHGDADHAAGAPAVLEAHEVGELWLGPGWWRHPRLRETAARARERGAATRLVWRGTRTGDIRVVSPSRAGSIHGGNADSLVLLLGREPWNLFVPGDLDGAALDRALAAGGIETTSAVVLAHHGSRHGTPDALLEQLEPRLALVSCGWHNRFGHPHPETLARLQRHAVPLRRTDHHGTIELLASESGWVVTTRPRTSRETR